MFDSFCAYRLPNEGKAHIFKGQVASGMTHGFVIAPFDLSIHDPLTIVSLTETDWQCINEIIQQERYASLLFKIPDESTPKEEHAREVETIVQELKGDAFKKTIAAKTICGNGIIDIKGSFNNLCHKFPDSFTFLYHTPYSGTWLGASPELLLESKNYTISTHALAGTRPAGTTANWDQKNIIEQEIVENYIVRLFEKWGLTPEISSKQTRKAGKVEHILTEIRSSSTLIHPLPFLKDYSPTPALCGYPKQESMERVKRLERFCRGYYGGFCGPFHSESEFALFVTLRAVTFNKERWCMFAGGGITSESIAEDEWIETERKAMGIINNLKFLSQ